MSAEPFYAAQHATWTCPKCGHALVFEQLTCPTDAAWMLENKCSGCGTSSSVLGNLQPAPPPAEHSGWAFLSTETAEPSTPKSSGGGREETTQ